MAYRNRSRSVRDWMSSESLEKASKMHSTSRLPEREAEQLPRELIELAKQIAKLPEDQQAGMETAYTRVVDAVNRRRRILSLVQEALSQLRLDIKYLMFDLEVTRRERDELREELGD